MQVAAPLHTTRRSGLSDVKNSLKQTLDILAKIDQHRGILKDPKSSVSDLLESCKYIDSLDKRTDLHKSFKPVIQEFLNHFKTIRIGVANPVLETRGMNGRPIKQPDHLTTLQEVNLWDAFNDSKKDLSIKLLGNFFLTANAPWINKEAAKMNGNAHRMNELKDGFHYDLENRNFQMYLTVTGPVELWAKHAVGLSQNPGSFDVLSKVVDKLFKEN